MNHFKDNIQNTNKGQANNQPNFQGHMANKGLLPRNEEKAKNTGGLLFILRKSEKLATALYMVTDIMPEREPMKWKMRESVVELLSDASLVLDATIGERIMILSTVIRKIEKIVSFLDIAQASRMVSEMNATVLKKEYLNLKSIIEGEWEKLFDRSKSIFTDSFFDVPEDYQSTFPQLNDDKRQGYENSEKNTQKNIQQNFTIEKDTEETIEIKGKIESAMRPPVRLGGNTPHAEKHPLPVKVHADPMNIAPKINDRVNEKVNALAGNIIPKIEIHAERLPDLRNPAHTEIITPASRDSRDTDLLVRRNEGEVGKGDRRTIILALIKQKPQLAVKDISKSIPGVSEKTIQRELLSMVAEGILQKRGERRWSTYSLREG